MSYNVRDDNATFGQLAAVEFLNGASAPTIARLQAIEPCGIFGVAGGTTFPAGLLASTTYTIFISPLSPSVAAGTPALGGNWQVGAITVFYSTAAGSAATIALENCAPGTANGSGTNILSATNYALNTALTTANTPQALALNSNVDNLTIAPGGRINVITGATSTASLADFTLAVYMLRVS